MSVGRARSKYFGFVSLLKEVQCAVNSRPLTYRDADVNNLEVLTPNSFLKIHSYSNLNFGQLDGSELQVASGSDLIKALNKREFILDKALTLWYESYLLSLRETSKDVYDKYWEDSIEVGDIVLISVPNKPRIWWQMGRVLELLTGADGKTRCVKLKTPSGEGVYSTCLLHPLEISLQDACVPANQTDHQTNVDADPVNRRPTRAAAQRCRERLRGCN